MLRTHVAEFAELSDIAKCDSEGEGVSAVGQVQEHCCRSKWTGPMCEGQPQWYAIHTRAQHERAVAARLVNEGITTFLPLVSDVHQWSDRRKVVEMPLFSCYAFVHLCLVPHIWTKVMRVNGVLRFVGIRGRGIPIADSQIESIRRLLSSELPCMPYPFLKLGQRVRIRGGSLEGIEGILVARNGNHSLVISLEPIQRSLAVRIDGYHFEPI